MKKLSLRLLSLLLSALLFAAVFSVLPADAAEGVSFLQFSESLPQTRPVSFPSFIPRGPFPQRLDVGLKVGAPASGTDSSPFRDSFFVDPVTKEEFDAIVETYDRYSRQIEALPRYDREKHPAGSEAENYLQLSTEILEFVFTVEERLSRNVDSAEMRYYITYDEASFNAYTEALYDHSSFSELYGKLLRACSESVLREFIFYDPSDEAVEEILGSTAPEGVSQLREEIAELQNRIVQLSSYSPEMPPLYGDLIAAQNRLAVLYGYDDYYSFAWENVYSRTYSEEVVLPFQDAAKRSLEGLSDKLIGILGAVSLPPAQDAETQQMYSTASAFLNRTESAFSEGAIHAFCEWYLERMVSADGQVNMKNMYDELMETGSYFLGKYPTGFTSLDYYEVPYLYFCTEKLYGYYPYSCGQTFLHEFGHYANLSLNGYAPLDFSLLETQSQSNETLCSLGFADWLSQNAVGANAAEAALILGRCIALDGFLSMLDIVRTGLVTDTFERAVYRGSYAGYPEFEDGITPDEYESLQQTISAEYGASSAVPAMHHSAYSSCYYLSYGTSAASACWLFADAVENGFAAAAEKYFKVLHLFPEEPNALPDYLGVLSAAGITSPFDEGFFDELYEKLLFCDAGHALTSFSAQPATCRRYGNAEYAFCRRCGTFFDGNGSPVEESASLFSDPVPCGAEQFTDLFDRGTWYHDVVDTALSLDLFRGVSETEFSPNGEMTRAMFVTVLWRMAGEPAAAGAAPFADVPADEWFTDAVAWAYENGISNGTGQTTFSPDLSITREQIASLLFRFSEEESSLFLRDDPFAGFSDADTVSAYAVLPMKWAISAGILNGSFDRGILFIAPRRSATRAECAALLCRYLNRTE